MKKINYLLVFAIVFSLIPSFANDALTLDQLEQKAIENDLQYKIDSIEVKKLQIIQYDAHKYSGKYDPDNTNSHEDLRIYQHNIIAPIQADNDVKYAMVQRLKNVDQLKNKLHDQIANLYLVEQKIKRIESEIVLAKKKQELAALKHKLGMAIELDINEAINAVHAKERELKSARSEKIAAELAIKSTAALPLNEALNVDYTLEEPQEYTVDTAVVEEQYKKYSLDVVKAQDQLEIAEGIFKKTKANFAPNLQEYKQNQLSEFKAKRLYQEAVKTAQTELSSKREQLILYYDNLNAAKEDLANAQQQYKNDQLQFKVGTISEIDQLNSADNVEAKQLELLEAINTYRSAVAEFKLMIKTYKVDISTRDYTNDDYHYYDSEELPIERAQ